VAVTTVQLLKKARALISDPKRWTQNAFARDKHGHAVPPQDSRAVRFCSIGAINHYAAESDVRTRSLARQALGEDIMMVNDFDSRRMSHATVLARFDHAIARRRA
jgi:hypothetical protein